MKIVALLLVTHLCVAAAGFAAGVYTLPILTAQPAPSAATIASAKRNMLYSGFFTPDSIGSDLLHWGDGTLSVGKAFIVFEGELAPGPDYHLYLSPVMIQDEVDFEHNRSVLKRIGEVDTFGDFILPIPDGTDVDEYMSVVIWCNAFGEFITSTKYR